MNRLTIAGSVLALATAGLSQSYVSSPPGYEKIEGRYNAYYTMGRYPGGRYMNFDSTYRGTAMTIKGLAYRLDNYIHTDATAMGRSFSKVTIHAAECDMSKLSRTFSLNSVTTPTKVFDTNVTWPSQIGKPPACPENWAVNFPFSTNWAYTGNNDLYFDLVFAGGTLANSATWNASQSRYYYLDALEDWTYWEKKSTPLGLYGNLFGCNDRGTSHLYGASVSTTARHYGSAPWNTNYADNLVFWLDGNHFGYSAQVMILLGLRSIEDGVQFGGVFCNKLHVDTSLPFVIFPYFTNASGTISKFYFGAPSTGIPAQASWAGVELATQCAWADKVNGSLLLSSAATVKVPKKPPFFNRSVTYSWDALSKTGSSIAQTYYYNPIARYTK